jgi:hypothetical protein
MTRKRPIDEAVIYLEDELRALQRRVAEGRLGAREERVMAEAALRAALRLSGRRQPMPLKMAA